MKRWLLWILVIVAVIAIGWYFFHRPDLRSAVTDSSDDTQTSRSTENATQAARITWQTVERPQDGIKLEMPSGAKDLQVPAYNTNGSTEQIETLVANPDATTTFTMNWEDSPPVARANRQIPQQTLEAARDGMLSRTQTFLVTESQLTVAGFPALDMTAKNTGGGVLDARLIYVNGRLYALIAVFPSVAARRQQDVERFYHSFTPQASGSGTANANS